MFKFKSNRYVKNYRIINNLESGLNNYCVFNAFYSNEYYALILIEPKCDLEAYEYTKFDNIVVLSLKEPVHFEVINTQFKKLIDFFKCDEASFDKNKWFFCPSKVNKSMNEVAIIRNDGELFDFNQMFQMNSVQQSMLNSVKQSPLETHFKIRKFLDSTELNSLDLYRAICVAVYYKDNKILRDIRLKAIQLGCHPVSFTSKVNKACRFVGKKVNLN